ncbi:MAG: hypothetical protein WDA11_03125 [Thiohalomonadaceae bacterium]
MKWKDTFIEDYAGHPLRVALNIFIIAATGICMGHYLFEVDISTRFLIGAMLPALFATMTASYMKVQRKSGRR